MEICLLHTRSHLARTRVENHDNRNFSMRRLGTVILLFSVIFASVLPILERPQIADAQSSEIIRNGDFETGDLTSWTVNMGSAAVTESEAHTGSYCAGLEGMTILSQGFQPAMPPPGNLTLWAKRYPEGYYNDLDLIAIYQDGTNDSFSLSLPDTVWTYYSLKINATKLLNQIDIITSEQDVGTPMLFDDISIKASFTLPSYVRDIYGHFRQILDIISSGGKVERAYNIVNLEAVFGERVSISGDLEDPTQDGWILVEVETASETLHYELQVKAHSRGDSWPMHGRDPSHSGFSVSTAPTNNSTRWNYTTGSTIEYSPAIADGMVFLSSSNDMRALNVTTGSLLWNFTRTVTSSPAVADGVVFLGASDGLYALNETSGLPVWRYSTSAPVYSSPIVCFGEVIFGCDNNHVYALNQTNKSVIWSFLADGPVRTSPGNSPDALADPRPTPIVIFGSNTTMYAVNMTSGASLWSYTCAVRSSPTFADGLVFFGAKGGLYSLNATTGALRWQFPTSAPVQSSPAVGDGRVFFGCNDLKVYALNETNGNELWSVMGEAAVTSSPAIAEDRVVFGQLWTKGDIRSQLTGELLWSFLASAPILSSPTLAYGNLFLGDTNGNLYCIGPQNDVATNAVVTSKTVVGQGYSVSINITAQNKGEVTETFYVSALHGGMIDELPVTLPPDGAEVVSIRWNTASAAMGNYTISGSSEAVPGETDTLDNLLTGAWVVVTIPGDVKGDFVVDIYDAIMLAGTYNSVPQSANWNPNTDINDDSTVDIYDAIILAGHYNQQYP
jgi:outer membrane protein assembly factor BamB